MQQLFSKPELRMAMYTIIDTKNSDQICCNFITELING